MGNYRVIGARKDDGSLIDEPIVADSPEDAVARANRPQRYPFLRKREIEQIDAHVAKADAGVSPTASCSAFRR